MQNLTVWGPSSSPNSFARCSNQWKAIYLSPLIFFTRLQFYFTRITLWSIQFSNTILFLSLPIFSANNLKIWEKSPSYMVNYLLHKFNSNKTNLFNNNSWDFTHHAVNKETQVKPYIFSVLPNEICRMMQVYDKKILYSDNHHGIQERIK